MTTVKSETFTSLTDLDDRFAFVKREGMRLLGIPESLDDRVMVKPEAIGLYAVEDGCNVKKLDGPLDGIRWYVKRNEGTFFLTVTV